MTCKETHSLRKTHTDQKSCTKTHVKTQTQKDALWQRHTRKHTHSERQTQIQKNTQRHAGAKEPQLSRYFLNQSIKKCVNHEVIQWAMNETFNNTSIHSEWKHGWMDYDR